MSIALGVASAGDVVARIDGAVFRAPSIDSLDELIAAPRQVWTEALEDLAEAHSAGRLQPAPVTQLSLPFTVGDYVDFYSSIEHATNLGRMFRPEGDPLLPNWRAMPVGYHGRASTVVVSGTPIRRPCGMLGPAAPDAAPEFAATRALDIELELGFVIGGPPNELGTPIPIEDAVERIFGVVLLNDWSARDIQRFEYQPLGPFLGKAFATSMSAWVVPIWALEGARVPGPRQEPPPAAHLRGEEPWNFDVDLEVALNGSRISSVNASGLYWSAAQQLAHLASGGAVVRPGDLLGTGTISGTSREQCGSLVEMGHPFLEDGDEVVLRGRAGAVELGEVAGRVVPALRQ